MLVVLIGVSSVCLALDVPRLPRDSLTKFVLDRMNYAFTAVFAFEMALKMCGFGTTPPPGSDCCCPPAATKLSAAAGCC